MHCSGAGGLAECCRYWCGEGKAATSPFTQPCSCKASGMGMVSRQWLPTGNLTASPALLRPGSWLALHKLQVSSQASHSPFLGEQGPLRAREGLLLPHLGREVNQLRERQLVPLIALQEIQQAPYKERCQGCWFSWRPAPILRVAQGPEDPSRTRGLWKHT